MARRSSAGAVENAVVLDVDGDRVSADCPGAFLEDYEARSVALERADDRPRRTRLLRRRR